MVMFYIILGVVAYLFFFLYDINSIILKNHLLNCCFFAGVFLQISATAGIIFTSMDSIKINLYKTGAFGVFALLFLCLLIYTLFFALPFKDTYVTTGSPPKVCDCGVYALCRHPGVLWLIGFYAFLGLALQTTLMITLAAIFSILDLLYVIFQDRWTFVKYFSNYKEYKTDTPFLLPNLKSIKRCLQTLSWKEGTIS
jgi:protein-S-isoprenylcysteine O-methyltransferase Ste14